MRILLILFPALFLLNITVTAQDTSSLIKYSQFSEKYLSQVSEKINKLESDLEKQTEKYIQKIAREEEKLYKKILKKDSINAKEIFGDINGVYNQLPQAAAEGAKKLGSFSKVYSGKLDSLSCVFKYLEIDNIPSRDYSNKVKDGLNSIEALQSKLDQTDQIRKFLKERKKILTEQLKKIGLTSKLKKFNKQYYYFNQQVKEFKQILENPSKAEEKIIGVLSEIPAFRKFFNQNSQLASLFRLPGSQPGNFSNSITGLQTRANIQQDLINRFGSGTNIQEAIQENLQGAQDQISRLKNELNKKLPAGGSSDEELPDFKPNIQKTKSFLQRLEKGTNFQTQSAQNIFPASTDFGLSLGYRLNDKSILGLGVSYRMGWGSGWNNIRITHQGIGLRSFADIKLKGSFFISGGYERNFRSEIRSIDQLQSQSAWQESGLIGLSKIVSVKSKFLKKTRFQVLWDFLSYDQVPKAQPIIFRVGYTF